MEVGTYKFHRRAFMALNQLTPEDQAQVLETLSKVSDTPASQWPTAQVKRLPGEPPLYLVPIDVSLRAVVRVAAGQEPEVMDIVRRETIEFFAKGASNSDN
jgi:hypothetical protein